MPRIEYRPSRRARPKESPRALALLTRILLSLALALALVIAACTVWALVLRPKSVPLPVSGPAPPVSPDTGGFTGRGRLRCPTADSPPALVILQASFPWFPGDRPFSE